MIAAGVAFLMLLMIRSPSTNVAHYTTTLCQAMRAEYALSRVPVRKV